MTKKYELLPKDNTGLHRIRALRSFVYVKKGDLGGYVEKEANLSHEGNAWVYGNAQVYDNAQVYGNAQVSGTARVYGNAQVFGNARVSGEAQVYDNARVYGNAQVSGTARVYGNAQVYGEALVYGNAWVSGDAQLCGEALVSGNAQVSGDAKIQHTYQCVSIAGLKYSLTSLPKGVQVGCKFYTLKEWKAKHVEVGLKEGLSEEECGVFLKMMMTIREYQHIQAKLNK